MSKFKDTAPYAKGNEASKQAARDVRHKLTGIRGQVYAYICRMGSYGATGSQIAEQLNILPYTAKPRCSELRDAGYIKDSGLMRPNINDRNETVWIAVDAESPVTHAPPAEKQKGALAKAREENKKMRKALEMIIQSKEWYISKNPESVKTIARRALPQDD